MSGSETGATTVVPRTRIKPTLRLAPSDWPAGAERRAAPRFTLLIRSAKLIGEGDEFLCVIRDAATIGVRVKLFHPFPERAGWEIELCNGQRYGLSKSWQRDELVGLRFTEPVPLEHLLQDAPPDRPKRPVRLRCAMPATVFGSLGPCEVTFRNISQQGACFECPSRLAIGERVRLESDFFPVIHAQVRWRRGKVYGVLFERSFAYGQLAQLCAEVCEDLRPVADIAASG